MCVCLCVCVCVCVCVGAVGAAGVSPGECRGHSGQVPGAEEGAVEGGES